MWPLKGKSFTWFKLCFLKRIRAFTYNKARGMLGGLGFFFVLDLSVSCDAVTCSCSIVSFLLSLGTKITLWNSSWVPLLDWEEQLCWYGQLRSGSQQVVSPWRYHINHSTLEIVAPFLNPASYLGYSANWGTIKAHKVLMKVRACWDQSICVLKNAFIITSEFVI